MHTTNRQNSLARYTTPSFYSTPVLSAESHVRDAVLYWPTRHFVLLGFILIGLLSLITTGIFWKAGQLAAYTPTPVLVVPRTETVKIPVTVELAEKQPLPAPPAPVADAGLTSIINNWVSNHPSVDWSISVKGLGDDGRFADYNSGKKRGLASIYKIFLMYPLLQKVPLDQFSATTITSDGVDYNLSTCVDAMLRYSNNECGIAVGRYVGWSNADRTLNKLGFSQTELYSANGTESSAADTAKLLKELYSGNMFTDTQRQYIIGILKEQTKRSGIPAGCSGCVVADKTGSLSYINNDAGIIYYADKNYVLSVLTNGAAFDSIASLTSQIQDYMKN